MATPTPERPYRIKIILVGVFFGLFFCVVICRAYQLQILSNAKLSRLADSQYKVRLTLSPRRGTVYDRHGHVLALDIQVASVGIHPWQIHDVHAVSQALSEHMNLAVKEIEEKLKSNKKFEWIKRRVPLTQGEAIEKLRLKGVQVEREFRRFYPNKTLAGQLLGAVGYDAVALGGLELSFDHYLREGSKKKHVERDARGRVISVLYENEQSQDLTLTIDKNIQHFAERALSVQAEKSRVDHGFAIVMDVESFEVLAMANYPPFNPNSYWRYKQDSWRNHALADSFEPGSTFKTILLAAGLDAGTLKVTDKFYCENGSYAIGTYVVNDHHPHAWLTAADVIKVSSNIGATKMAFKVGGKTFYEKVIDLGFNRQIHGNLVDEGVGRVRHYKGLRPIELSNLAFGQGLSVTGLQMATAYAAMANGGKLGRPKIVQKIVRGENQGEMKRQVLKAETATQIKKILATVTSPGGTAPVALPPGYTAAGKTGTAQKYDEKTKTYADGRYVSSFIGFVPAEEPKFLIYVVYDNPRVGGYYGGVVAAPVFRQISEDTLKYAGVLPSTLQQGIEHDGKVLGETVSPVAAADGFAPSSLAKISSAVKQNTVPDLRGLSLRKVFEIVDTLGVRPTVVGSGVVVTQTPLPGSVLHQGQEWSLQLSPDTT